MKAILPFVVPECLRGILEQPFGLDGRECTPTEAQRAAIAYNAILADPEKFIAQGVTLQNKQPKGAECTATINAIIQPPGPTERVQLVLALQADGWEPGTPLPREGVYGFVFIAGMPDLH